MTSSFTPLSVAEDKEEEEEEEEWILSMLIFLSFCFGDSNLRVEDKETNPVSRERLRKEKSEAVETWERDEGESSFLSTDEKSRERREEESDVLETWGTGTSLSAIDVSSRRMEGWLTWLPPCFTFLPFFFLCLFPPDASTMDEVTTIPNKNSDNNLHWI